MKKTLEWWGSRGYLYHPTISFVMDAHNMGREVIESIRELRKFDDAEIIIMDDGSSHDYTKLLLDELAGVNEFLLHSNDLFGVLIMNRTFYYAKGKYIAKIQDDDVYKGTAWVARALALFEKYPDLAILGGRDTVVYPDGWDEEKDKPIVRRRCQKFEFVQAIDEAPMWIRRSDFIELGGLDEDFAPFFMSEIELCFKAWLSGKSVGWYPSGLIPCGINTDERRLTKRPLSRAAWAKNRKLLCEKFGDRFGEVAEMAERRNAIENLEVVGV